MNIVDPVTLTHLAAARTFSVLPASMLRAIAPLFRRVTVPPGAILSRENDVDASLYVVVDGAVALDHRGEAGSPRHVATLAYGEVVGERGVFADLPSHTTAVALQPSEVMVADRDALWSALSLEPGTLDLLVLPDDVRTRMDLPRAGAADVGERTVAVLQKHRAALLVNLLLPAVVLAGSLLLTGILTSFATSTGAVLALMAVGLALPALTFSYALLDYRNDLLVLTNRRVIHQKGLPFIRSRRIEVPLAHVQDVQVVVPGVSARTFGYGTIRIQSAASAGGLEFDMVPAPEAAKDTIFRLAEFASVETRQERSGWIRDRLQPAVSPGSGPVAMRGVGPDQAGADAPVPARSTALVWRPHWWLFARRSGLAVLASAACLAAAGRTAAIGGPIPSGWWLGLFVPLGLWSLYRYQDWRNDVYIVGEEHIADVARKPFGLYVERREALLSQIQDIRHIVPNPLATLLDYGDVVIETASENGRFTFLGVPHPARVHDEIFARIQQQKAAEARRSDESRADELAQWFREYHEMAKGRGGYADVNEGLATSEGIG